MYSRIKNCIQTIFIFCSLLFSFIASAQTGCTDYQALNYDPLALVNDGSCTYVNTQLPLVIKCLIDSAILSETSGIAKEGNNYWTHVDDGDNAIYRIDTLSDSIFQRVVINNAVNNDWEDITSDPTHIYIGDVGNNDGNRTDLRLYKILDSDITSATTSVNAGKIKFSYADQTNFTINHNYNFYDCEAFFFLNDSIHLFTKGWVNKWTKHYVMSADTGTHVAQLVDSFNVTGLITSAAIQGDSLVVLLGLNFTGGNNCFVWMLSDFQGTKFFSGNKRKFAIGGPFTTGQTEGICFTDTNKGYITNELLGNAPARLRQFDLNPYLAPAPVAPLFSASVHSFAQNLSACSDSGYVTLTIKNLAANGYPDLTISIPGGWTWMTVSPAMETVSPGDSAAITINYFSGLMAAGSYHANISIQTNDPLHAVEIIPFTLNVDSNPCISFSYTSDSCTGFFNFTSTSVNNPSYYLWNFGDGDTSNNINPSHNYALGGNYNVTVIACNSRGCDTVTQTVTASINGPKPTTCYPTTLNYCCGMGITHFQLTSSSGDVINNNSSDAGVGFEDFSCITSGALFTNNPYILNCTTASTFAEYLKVWLDMNNDGILDSVSELLYSDLDTIAPIHSGVLTVPALATNVYGVPLRLRVASDFQQLPLPCLNPSSGQQEDYSVILNFSVNNDEKFPDVETLNVYPNPFTNYTNLSFNLKSNSHFKIEAYDLIGNRINLVGDSELIGGNYNYELNLGEAGIYFLRIKIDERILEKKLIKIN